jgi:hypothetical protein
MMRRARFAAAGVVAAWCGWAHTGDAAASEATAIRVERSEIAEAMLEQKQQGYEVLATANGARFTARVLLRLAARARERDPSGRPLLLDHQDYFEAFLQAAAVPPEAAPAFIRVARDHREDQLVDYRRERVLARIVKGREPALAVNVVAGWPAGPGVPDEYSYEDRVSRPPLRVIHKRVNSYRLLDFGDMLVFDEIQGVGGRATGGLLGLMFKVIGDGQAVRSFAAVAPDGIQVTRTTARKGFITVTQTATVFPEDRLEEPFEARYVPLANADPAKWRE